MLNLQRSVGNAVVAASLSPTTVQRNPQGGNGQGQANERPRDGLSRLRRANRRAENRGTGSAVVPGQGTSPFGAYTVQSGRDKGGYITSNTQQHPGTSPVGTHYAEVFEKLQQHQLPLLAEALRGRALDGTVLSRMTAVEKRAAAVLYGLIKEAEDTRTPGAIKSACNALDTVGLEGGGWTRFKQLFPMAQHLGAQVYNLSLSGQNELSPEALQNLEDMSSSSDEDML